MFYRNILTSIEETMQISGLSNTTLWYECKNGEFLVVANKVDVEQMGELVSLKFDSVPSGDAIFRWSHVRRPDSITLWGSPKQDSQRFYNALKLFSKSKT